MPLHFLLVKQRGREKLNPEAKHYISHYPFLIPHNFPRVGIWRLGKREKCIVCITASLRGEGMDKRAGVGEEERWGKRESVVL